MARPATDEAVSKAKTLEVIVSPSDTKDYNEVYAISGIKKIPYGKRVTITQHDLEQLKQQKLPIMVDKHIDVHQIMDEMKITQEKANLIAREMAQDSSMNKSFRYVPKYHIEILSRS